MKPTESNCELFGRCEYYQKHSTETCNEKCPHYIEKEFTCPYGFENGYGCCGALSTACDPCTFTKTGINFRGDIT